jgi:hypothetical protein
MNKIQIVNSVGVASNLGPILGVATGLAGGLARTIGGFVTSRKKDLEAQKALSKMRDFSLDDALIQKMKNKRLAMETGVGNVYQAARRANQQAGNQMRSGIMGMAGGNTGSALSAMEGAQRIVNEANAKNLDQQGQLSVSLFTKEAELEGEKAKTVRDINTVQYSQAQADKTNAMKTGVSGLQQLGESAKELGSLISKK